MSHTVVLQILNGIVGVWYVVLSVCFAALWLTVGTTIAGRRALNLPRWAAPTLIVGSALFLAGCGLHHFTLAFSIIPEATEKFGAQSLWLAHYGHHVILSSAQVIGAPMVLVAGFTFVHRLRKVNQPRSPLSR